MSNTKFRQLRDLPRDDYFKLKGSGMMWEFHPEATGDWWEDCGKYQEKEVRERQELMKKLDELNKPEPVDLKSRRREFKFRVWDTLDNKWTTNDSKLKLNDIVVWYPPSTGLNGLFTKEPRYFFQQFTGLKDSKGNDIYEGDIVRVNGELREIIWRGCMFTTKWAEYSLNACWFVGGGPEVVGNICENPELVKGLK